MIPLVKPYIAPPEKMMPAIEEILYSGYIAEGDAVYKFEEEFGGFIGNNRVLALNSGTAALHIALTLLNLKPGDEVISTALTAEPTNTTILLTGAKVIWGDVDINTGLLDPKSVREKITDRTKAIVLVHYAGMVCDMEEFNKISKEYDIPIIEDAAHALGSKYNKTFVGSNSKFTCFSFQAIKQMTTVDGGVIAIKDEKDVSEARKLRWFGLDKKLPRLENDITRAGYKYGMNNVNATIGRIQLTKLSELLSKYISNGKFYDRHLDGVPGVKMVSYYKNTEPSYWLYTMKVEKRDDFIEWMRQNDITVSQLHHRSDTHSVFHESKCELPALDKFYQEFIHIPCGWWVDEEKRDHIVKVIRQGW